MFPVSANESTLAAPRPRLIRRLLSPLPEVAAHLETFEPRLALSANPGAERLLGTLESLHPQASTAPPSAIPGVGEEGGLPAMVDQASAVRDKYGLSGAGQTIAVIDSGVAWDHVALGQGFGGEHRVVGGWDFAENDANPYDDGPAGFHGTHVSGLVIGDGNSATGIAPGADLVGLRVFDDLGRGSLDWIESALQWVYDHRDAFASPITTVNLSIGALLPDALADEVQGQLEDELRQLHDASIVVVAAAGNAFDASFPDRLNYPASSPLAWAVASNDASHELSSFSQRHDGILSTLGRSVISTVPDHVLGMDGEINDFHTASGTSMAAPQVAAASMLVRQALEQVGGDASPDRLFQILHDTAARRTDAVTGIQYAEIDLSAAIASVLGAVRGPDGESPAEPPPAQSTDLGIVSWDRVIVDTDAYLHVTAVREGLFSIGIDADHRGAGLRVLDDRGTILWEGPVPASGQLDIPVVEHQRLSIHAPGAAGGATLQLANVIGLKGGHLEIASGPADPDVAIDLRSGLAATVGDFNYHFPAGSVISGVLDGGDRADHLSIQGSSAAARLVLHPYADGTLSEGGVEFVLRGFEDVRFEGGGGGDRVYLYDTRGDDRLNASPGTARLEGVGFRYEVSNVERSYVYATAGGQDMAFMNDSAGNDLLAVRPQFVSLRGGEFFNLVYGFERVYAYATEGGQDRADLYDSSGDDRLTASASSAMISGPGYYAQARGFGSTTGHAIAGGFDRAVLYADDGAAGTWFRTADQVTLHSPGGADRIARGFDHVETYQAGVPVKIATLGGLDNEELRRRELGVLQAIFAEHGGEELEALTG